MAFQGTCFRALYSDQGSAMCPCVPSLLPFGIHNASSVIVESRVYDYGRAYGRGGCAAHDALMPPHCRVVLTPNADNIEVELPSWCFLPWCYVNASNCADHFGSTASTYDWGVPIDPDLHFSYATCNATDLYTASYLESEVVRQSLDEARRRQVFYLRVLLPSLLTGTLLAACMAVWLVRRHFQRRQHAGRLRCVADNSFAVATPLPAGLTYHLFLSHAWQHGQDQMRLVKDRFLEMLPTLRVFLDVDDMKEVRSQWLIDPPNAPTRSPASYATPPDCNPPMANQSFDRVSGCRAMGRRTSTARRPSSPL